MKYEIEFVVPVVFKDPFYSKRLLDFREVGFLNIPHDKKIKVVLLTKKGTVDHSLLQGWPKRCDLQVNQYNTDSHIAKLCQYSLDLNVFDSKWYVAVDDDSVTDVGGLCKTLSNYSPHALLYFSTPYHYYEGEIEELTTELEILKKMKGLHLLNSQWDHDWESHYVSRKAMMQTLRHPFVRKYLKRRKTVDDGYSDQFMAYSARIAGVPIIDAWFSTPHPTMKRLSLFGGHLNHIHYVSYDNKNMNQFRQLLKDCS